jgi:hypothetical protein
MPVFPIFIGKTAVPLVDFHHKMHISRHGLSESLRSFPRLHATKLLFTFIKNDHTVSRTKTWTQSEALHWWRYRVDKNRPNLSHRLLCSQKPAIYKVVPDRTIVLNNQQIRPLGQYWVKPVSNWEDEFWPFSNVNRVSQTATNWETKNRKEGSRTTLDTENIINLSFKARDLCLAEERLR